MGCPCSHSEEYNNLSIIHKRMAEGHKLVGTSLPGAGGEDGRPETILGSAVDSKATVILSDDFLDADDDEDHEPGQLQMQTQNEGSPETENEILTSQVGLLTNSSIKSVASQPATNAKIEPSERVVFLLSAHDLKDDHVLGMTPPDSISDLTEIVESERLIYTHLKAASRKPSGDQHQSQNIAPAAAPVQSQAKAHAQPVNLRARPTVEELEHQKSKGRNQHSKSVESILFFAAAFYILKMVPTAMAEQKIVPICENSTVLFLKNWYPSKTTEDAFMAWSMTLSAILSFIWMIILFLCMKYCPNPFTCFCCKKCEQRSRDNLRDTGVDERGIDVETGVTVPSCNEEDVQNNEIDNGQLVDVESVMTTQCVPYAGRRKVKRSQKQKLGMSSWLSRLSGGTSG